MTGKGKVTSRIIKYLRSNIQEGNWVVGERIPSENELCAELGVSRVSVRNAIQQLTALGILESVHGKGTYLISNDLSVFAAPAPHSQGDLKAASILEMQQVLDVRRLIEPSICARVAETADEALLERLASLLDQMQKNVGKSREFVKADMRFHMELCLALNNPLLTHVMAELFQTKEDTHYQLNMAVGFYGGIYYHQLILNALQKHDVKRAHAVMTEHLERSIDDLALEASEEAPPPGDD